MQTFLVYPDFTDTARVLDRARLGKQRVEAFQILCALDDPWALSERGRRLEAQGKAPKPSPKGWRNHTATRMWRGSEECLGAYMNSMIDEWSSRGYTNTMVKYPVSDAPDKPSWMSDPDRFELLMVTHRSNLIRKDPDHYSKFWPDIPDNLEYYWPKKRLTTKK